MKRQYDTPRLLLICILIILSGVNHAFAANSQGLDVVLVLDSSGSMKQNDPMRMRIQAAKMFVTLLDKRDRVALVSFSDKAYPVTQLLPLSNSQNETSLLQAIDKITAKGAHTNLHDALKSGYELLHKDKDSKREKIIILMSDGKMDVGQRELDLRLLERTLEELTPAMAKENIKVYSIAFTETSYIPLLKLAAKDTNGHFTLLKDASTTHKVFESIFERSKDPDMLPLQEDSFIVDKNVKEITIIASKFRADSFISLENPSGTDFNEETENPNISWFSAKQFDLITILNPQAGYWLIKYSEGGNKAYILTDLALDVSVSKKEAQPGTPFEVQAWLSKKDTRITKRSLLSSTRFTVKITHPDSTKSEVKLKDDGSEVGSNRRDGIYGATLSFEEEGLYKLEVFTQGETFDRQRTAFITVKALEPSNPFEIKDKLKPAIVVEPEPEPVHEPAPEPKSKPMQVQKPEPVVESAHPVQQPEEVLKPLNEHDVHEPVKLAEHENAMTDALANDEAKPEKEPIDWTAAIIAFVLINLSIGGGLTGWHFYKKMKKAKATPEDGGGVSIDLGSEEVADVEQLTENLDGTAGSAEDKPG